MTREEALIRIKTWRLDDDSMEVLSTLIPELKEDENDEKIRKGLIQHLRILRGWTPGDPSPIKVKEHYDSWIAWLEKRCDQIFIKRDTETRDLWEYIKEWRGKLGRLPEDEDELADCIYYVMKRQKPDDTPKFKIGDWVVSKQNKIGRVNQIQEDTHGIQRYHIEFTDGTKTYPRPCYADDDFHLWTVRDAKDGDVICAGQIIILFKGWESNTSYNFAIAYAGIDISGKLQITDGHWLISNESKPASPEQCDLLFSKMKEEGYKWDEENKELKKIDIKAEHGEYYYCIKDYFSGGKKFSSKGDVVQALRGLPIMGLEDISEYFLPVYNILKVRSEWDAEKIELKKIGKSDSAWSEEDEEMFECIKSHVEYAVGVSYPESKQIFRKRMINWLESLKSRVHPPSKWNEEDKKKIDLLIAILEVNHPDALFKVNPIYSEYGGYVYERTC